MASTLTTTQSPFYSGYTFTSGQTVSTNYTIVGTSSVDRRIYGLGVTSSDNAANNMFFSISDGSNTFPICRLPISLSAGTNTTTAVYDVKGSSLMAAFASERDSNGATFFHLPKNCSLVAQYQSTLGTNEYLTVHVQGHNY